MKVSAEKTETCWFSNATSRGREPLRLKLGDTIIRQVDNPKFLGIWLDKNISLTYHCKWMALRCEKQVNLIYKLASTSKRANCLILKRLFLALVRSLREGHLHVLSFCKENALQPLIQMQNRALRKICGVLPTSNQWFVGALCGVEPIVWRGKLSKRLRGTSVGCRLLIAG